MLNFLFAVLLSGCLKSTKQADSSVAVDSTVEDTSPIHWEDCSYRIGAHICDIQLTANTGKIILEWKKQ